ncbi:hypothetical protein EDWATA_02603 [Edwardsiella tarda ATCC 23685]|uniref:Uncharacterized protein n=1 Tax=Edwardsiella tarda ATCC 23685 TaxID=500638 RepID=D4F769_EDWTA|nr:hypothetical protein EDWATA_02603 [Edwardsiella tarda ATCC 23685]
MTRCNHSHALYSINGSIYTNIGHNGRHCCYWALAGDKVAILKSSLAYRQA